MISEKVSCFVVKVECVEYVGKMFCIVYGWWLNLVINYLVLIVIYGNGKF